MGEFAGAGGRDRKIFSDSPGFMSLCVWVFVCMRNISHAHSGDANERSEWCVSCLVFLCAGNAGFSVMLQYASCMWLACICVFVVCRCSGVCSCVLGCEPSILLTPSGLCVGLFHQHYHLLVFYSGPQGYNDCTTFQICSSSPSDWLPYLKSGSHFLSELDSLVLFS